jgi:hypothetical protein
MSVEVQREIKEQHYFNFCGIFITQSALLCRLMITLSLLVTQIFVLQFMYVCMLSLPSRLYTRKVEQPTIWHNQNSTNFQVL